MKYLAFLALLFVQLSCAVDNPEASNHVADFEERIKVYEYYISNTAASTLDFSKGYGELYDALDKELNIAYSSLMSKLNEEEKQLLKSSQRRWIKYRDAEYEFIATSITRDKFGSSAVISKGEYRTALLKARVTELLWYLNKHS